MEKENKVIWVTTQAKRIDSGPGRIASIVRELDVSNVEVLICSDQLDSTNKKEIRAKSINALRKLPGYYIIRSYFFYRAIKGSHLKSCKVVFSNAYEAFFSVLVHSRKKYFVLINDDNYLLAKGNFKQYVIDYGFKKAVKRRFGFYIERYIAKRAHRIIACSKYLAEMIRKKYQLGDDCVFTLYPVLDSPFMLKNVVKKERNDQINLLFLKSDFKRGGLELLINALALSKKSQFYFLTIAGISKKHKNEIFQMIDSCGYEGKVEWKGHINNVEDIVELYKKTDCLVLCSKQEAFGIVLIEAASLNKAILATEVGGIKEATLNGQTGILVSEPDKLNLISLFSRPNQFWERIYLQKDMSHLIQLTYSKENFSKRFKEIIFE